MPHLTPNTDVSELEGSEFLPGLVPDPLYPQNFIVLGAYRALGYAFPVIGFNDPNAGAPGSAPGGRMSRR